MSPLAVQIWIESFQYIRSAQQALDVAVGRSTHKTVNRDRVAERLTQGCRGVRQNLADYATVAGVNLLLGGLITLSVTALVQILIIPWVQRRNRMIERWEREVIDLANVLEEELPPALRRLRWTTGHLRTCLKITGLEDFDQARVKEATKTAEADAAAAYDAVEDLTTRMQRREKQIALVNRHSPYWGRLAFRMRYIDLAFWQVDPQPWGLGRGLDDDAFEAEWNALEDHRAETVKILNEITEKMKRPRTYPIRRARSWIKARPASIRNRITERRRSELPPAS